LEGNLREGGIYFHLEINIERPFVLWLPLKLKNGEEKWVDFKFKRLPNFCYHCGKLGHEIRKRDDNQKRVNF